MWRDLFFDDVLEALSLEPLAVVQKTNHRADNTAKEKSFGFDL